MSKIPGILSATLTVSLAACGGGGKDPVPIGLPVTTPVVTPEAAPTGMLTVFNSTDGLFITATADAGYELLETRLFVTKSLECVPRTKNGSPNLNRSMLRRKGSPAAAELSYNLPLLVEPGTELFIVLHADVRRIATPGEDEGKEHDDCDDDEEEETLSAWAQGTTFPGGSGAMYLSFTVKAAGAPSLVGLYRTHPQAAWGASSSNAATAYLTGNFMSAFPGGVTIGAVSGNTAQFSSAGAIMTFLPQAGGPAALNRRWMNPVDLANSLAGETLALTLNTSFDAQDPSFSPSPSSLANLMVADPASAFFGRRVADVLATANTLLSGRADPLGATLTDTLDAVERINANFESGTADLGFLSEP